MPVKPWLVCSCLSAVLLLVGCSAPKRPAVVQDSYAVGDELTPQESFNDRILKHFAKWQGVPYRLGGNTMSGIDCSAFVQITFRDVFKMKLPRTTAAQSEIGADINREDLSQGDLVLFKTSRRSRHVGIYMGNGQFMHASTSNGVMISELNNPYWKRHYWKSVRPSLVLASQ